MGGIIPADKIAPAAASLKLAQILALIKNNQLATAVLVFVAWQLGYISDALSLGAGLC